MDALSIQIYNYMAGERKRMNATNLNRAERGGKRCGRFDLINTLCI
jgi:hypothetical protein